MARLCAHSAAYGTGVRRSAHHITSSTPRPEAELGAYRKLSSVIEPIQPPIVPLNLFAPQSLRTNEGV